MINQDSVVAKFITLYEDNLNHNSQEADCYREFFLLCILFVRSNGADLPPKLQALKSDYQSFIQLVDSFPGEINNKIVIEQLKSLATTHMALIKNKWINL